MKPLIIILFLTLAACGRESSPEGRSQLRTEKLQKQIDSLKVQNKAILDSLSLINEKLKEINFERNLGD